LPTWTNFPVEALEIVDSSIIGQWPHRQVSGSSASKISTRRHSFFRESLALSHSISSAAKASALLSASGFFRLPENDIEVLVDRSVQQRCDGRPVVAPRDGLVPLTDLAAGRRQFQILENAVTTDPVRSEGDGDGAKQPLSVRSKTGLRQRLISATWQMILADGDVADKSRVRRVRLRSLRLFHRGSQHPETRASFRASQACRREWLVGL
jgi:hypothetical protein